MVVDRHKLTVFYLKSFDMALVQVKGKDVSGPKARKYLFKDTTDIRASMKGSANQDEDKPVRLQSPSDALFTKVRVAG